ncbi:MAG: 50S ribosomal protein L13 [Candidatus Sumerlaeota bacterium]|nr:50S ribosomal protein L13 [Candidatus Sumerlaeota bacterium]
MKTMSAKPTDLKERWYVIDAKDQVLGRLAAQAAHLLRGKHLANFTPHANMQTHVVIINAGEIKLTGNKWRDKVYYHHTGWPGGIKAATAGEIQEKKPGEIVRIAVKGMLPKNRLGDATLTRLRVYAGPEHRHKAQNPEPYALRNRYAQEAQ